MSLVKFATNAIKWTAVGWLMALPIVFFVGLLTGAFTLSYFTGILTVIMLEWGILESVFIAMVIYYTVKPEKADEILDKDDSKE